MSARSDAPFKDPALLVFVLVFLGVSSLLTSESK